MSIDGYYVPTELGKAAQLRANETGKAQHIGVRYGKDGPEEFSWGEVMQRSAGFLRDLQVGRHCSWEFGPAYEELRDHCAVILWITPQKQAESFAVAS